MLQKYFEEDLQERPFEESFKESKKEARWFKEKALEKECNWKELMLVGACKCQILFKYAPL